MCATSACYLGSAAGHLIDLQRQSLDQLDTLCDQRSLQQYIKEVLKQPGSPGAPSFQLDRQDTRRDARKVCLFMSTAGLWAANASYRFRTRSTH